MFTPYNKSGAAMAAPYIIPQYLNENAPVGKHGGIRCHYNMNLSIATAVAAVATLPLLFLEKLLLATLRLLKPRHEP